MDAQASGLLGFFKNLITGSHIEERRMHTEHEKVTNLSSTAFTGDRLDKLPIPTDKGGYDRYQFIEGSARYKEDTGYITRANNLFRFDEMFQHTLDRCYLHNFPRGPR